MSCLMESFVRLALTIVLLESWISPTVQTQKSPTDTGSNDVIDHDAQTLTSFDNRVSTVDSRIDRLESLMQDINVNMKGVMETANALSELRTENAELRRMLGNFEYFFGRLYDEKPEFFDAQLGLEKRMSALNQYLGNKEAELAGLRPSPVTMIDREATFDPELLGKALAQLTQENLKLADKVAILQQKVDITSPTNSGVRDDVTVAIPRRSPRDLRPQNGSRDADGELLATVERMVARDLETVVSNLSRDMSRNLSRNASHSDIVDDGVAVAEEIVRLAEDVLEDQNPSRRRKLAFSASRTSSMFGRNNSHQVVRFDNVFVDKGRDYDLSNGTYVCDVTGFYYISFNLRSYDGFHIGVTLHKNDDVITAVYTDRSDRNVMESQSVILHLEKGDRLYLLLGPSDRYAVYSDLRNYSTFNIFLLYRGY